MSRLGARRSRGSALLLNLMAIAVFASMAGVVYVSVRSGMRSSVYAMRQAQALAIAEAGLEDALQALRKEPEWRTGFTDKPFAGGRYTVTLSSASLPVIVSTGYSEEIAVLGSAVKSVTVVTNWTPSQCPYAIGANRISVEGTVDRYDPELSLTPSATDFTDGADVYSNDDVLISGACPPVKIRGDAYGQGVLPSASCVSGSVVTTTTTLQLPSYPCATCSTVNDNLAGISPLSAYNSASKQLVVNNETVTLQPGIYYFKKLTLKNGGILNAVTSSGTVAIYLDGNFDSDAPCEFNNTSKVASRLKLYDLANAGHSVPFVCSTPIHAYIEGVWAQAYVEQEFYGHFCADRVTVTSAGKLHWDGGSFAHAGWTVGSEGSWTEGYERQ